MPDPAPRTAAPCADCGDVFGFVGGGSRRPSRMSGTRFGIDGPLCVACYYRHRYRQVVRPRRLAERRSLTISQGGCANAEI